MWIAQIVLASKKYRPKASFTFVRLTRQLASVIPFLIVNRNNESGRSVCFSVKPVVNEG